MPEKMCSRKFVHHMKAYGSVTTGKGLGHFLTLPLLKLLKLKKNSTTVLQLLNFFILKKELRHFLTTLKDSNTEKGHHHSLEVFNTEKGLHHFIRTLRVFNIEKGLHHFLETIKGFNFGK